MVEKTGGTNFYIRTSGLLKNEKCLGKYLQPELPEGVQFLCYFLHNTSSLNKEVLRMMYTLFHKENLKIKKRNKHEKIKVRC